MKSDLSPLDRISLVSTINYNIFIIFFDYYNGVIKNCSVFAMLAPLLVRASDDRLDLIRNIL